MRLFCRELINLPSPISGQRQRS